MTGTIQQAQKQKKENKNDVAMKGIINSYKGAIAKALPKMIDVERFTRIAITAVTKNPELQKCEPSSFIAALLTSAQLGLEPNTPLGQAYLIPYGNKCEFQLGYKGLLELAHRSGELKTLEAHIVYENDEFNIEYGLNPKLIHKPNFRNRGEAIGVYAVYHLNNGGYAFDFMTMEEIKEHKAKHSKTGTAWAKDFNSMAKKTVIKRLLKYAPLKIEFVTALANDEQSPTIDFTEDNELIILNEDVNDIEENQEEVEVGKNE